MLLIDASVWVAAVDPDDRFHSASRSIVLDPARQLAALDLTLYEVGNVIGARKRRPDVALRLCSTILARCTGQLVAVDAELIDSALQIALEQGLSAYDAAYVAAARGNDWTLLSADLADLVSKDLAVAPDSI